MKTLNTITKTLVFLSIICFTFQCASPKDTTVYQQETQFSIKKVYFQEWYAGIDVGGTGVNIFVPIVNKPNSIKIDSVFFRNLKGKLVEKGGRYSAVLKNQSKAYTFNPNDNPSQYPFKLTQNECVVSYIENGETKYKKVHQPSEYAGTYYKEGAPSEYIRPKSTDLATLDEEDDN